MDRVFNAMLDRTRSRLYIPACGPCSGPAAVPASTAHHPSPRVWVVLETPAWDLTVFKVHFGLLTLKGYTKGARVLRFEAITHNTRQLAAAWPWSASPRSSPGWPACASGSAPRWTALISASSPTARWISCRCPRNWAPAK